MVVNINAYPLEDYIAVAIIIIVYMSTHTPSHRMYAYTHSIYP